MLEINPEERRRFPRFLITLPLVCFSDDSGKLNQAETRDISVRGVGFITAQKVNLHTPLEVRLLMPDNGEELQLKGEVVWFKQEGLNTYRVGVSLEDSGLKPIPLVLRTIQYTLTLLTRPYPSV